MQGLYAGLQGGSDGMPDTSLTAVMIIFRNSGPEMRVVDCSRHAG